MERQSDIEMDRQIERKMDSQLDRWIIRQMDNKIHRWIIRQIYRYMVIDLKLVNTLS